MRSFRNLSRMLTGQSKDSKYSVAVGNCRMDVYSQGRNGLPIGGVQTNKINAILAVATAEHIGFFITNCKYVTFSCSINPPYRLSAVVPSLVAGAGFEPATFGL